MFLGASKILLNKIFEAKKNGQNGALAAEQCSFEIGSIDGLAEVAGGKWGGLQYVFLCVFSLNLMIFCVFPLLGTTHPM